MKYMVMTYNLSDVEITLFDSYLDALNDYTERCEDVINRKFEDVDLWGLKGILDSTNKYKLQYLNQEYHPSFLSI